MLTRPIPRSNEQIPLIGLGTWQTFDVSPSSARDVARLAEVARAFLDGGGRLIDSSPMYGRAEEVVGMALKELDAVDDAFVATKVWTRGEREGRKQLDDSTRLLGKSPLDLEQIHNLVDWRTQLAMLREKKAAGAVRYVGVTHYTTSSLEDLERAIRSEQLDFVQLPYSLGVRAAEKRLLPAAKDTGTAVIVNRPFEEGNAFAHVRSRPVPDWVARFARSWSQAFLKFIVAHPAVTCVIPATGNVEHLRENLECGSDPLPTGDELRKLAALL